MERWGVTSQSCDPVDRCCRHVDRPDRNHTASTRSLRPAPDTSDLSSRTTSTSQSEEACTDDTECDSEDHIIPPQPCKFIVFDAYDSESDSDYNSDDGNSSDDEKDKTSCCCW